MEFRIFLIPSLEQVIDREVQEVLGRKIFRISKVEEIRFSIEAIDLSSFMKYDLVRTTLGGNDEEEVEGEEEDTIFHRNDVKFVGEDEMLLFSGAIDEPSSKIEGVERGSRIEKSGCVQLQFGIVMKTHKFVFSSNTSLNKHQEGEFDEEMKKNVHLIEAFTKKDKKTIGKLNNCVSRIRKVENEVEELKKKVELLLLKSNLGKVWKLENHDIPVLSTNPPDVRNSSTTKETKNVFHEFKTTDQASEESKNEEKFDPFTSFDPNSFLSKAPPRDNNDCLKPKHSRADFRTDILNMINETRGWNQKVAGDEIFLESVESSDIFVKRMKTLPNSNAVLGYPPLVEYFPELGRVAGIVDGFLYVWDVKSRMVIHRSVGKAHSDLLKVGNSDKLLIFVGVGFGGSNSSVRLVCIDIESLEIECVGEQPIRQSTVHSSPMHVYDVNKKVTDVFQSPKSSEKIPHSFKFMIDNNDEINIFKFMKSEKSPSHYFVPHCSCKIGNYLGEDEHHDVDGGRGGSFPYNYDRIKIVIRPSKKYSNCVYYQRTDKKRFVEFGMFDVKKHMVVKTFPVLDTKRFGYGGPVPIETCLRKSSRNFDEIVCCFVTDLLKESAEDRQPTEKQYLASTEYNFQSQFIVLLNETTSTWIGVVNTFLDSPRFSLYLSHSSWGRYLFLAIRKDKDGSEVNLQVVDTLKENMKTIKTHVIHEKYSCFVEDMKVVRFRGNNQSDNNEIRIITSGSDFSIKIHKVIGLEDENNRLSLEYELENERILFLKDQVLLGNYEKFCFGERVKGNLILEIKVESCNVFSGGVFTCINILKSFLM